MRILIGRHVLFDDSDGRETLSDFSGDIARLIQVVQPIRADEIDTFFRGVKRTDLSFTISREEADPALTLERLLWDEARIPETGNIQIECQRAGGGTRTIYLRGKFQSCRVWHIGLRVFRTFRLICGKPRLIKP